MDQFDQTKQELNNVSEEHAKVLTDNVALIKQVEDLFNQNRVLSDTQSKYESLQHKYSQLNADTEQSTKQIETFQLQTKEMQIQNNLIQEELQSTRTQLQTTVDELNLSKEAYHSLDGRMHGLLSQMEQTRQDEQQFKSMSVEFERLRQSESVGHVQQEMVSQELDKLRFQYDKVMQYCQELQMQVNIICNIL
jgi:chromosome segregation ATPase